MQKLLILFLCLPMIGLGQYEPNIGSQERKDISNAIRDSVGQEYLCKYEVLLISGYVAYAEVELMSRYTNEYSGSTDLFLRKDYSGWYVIKVGTGFSFEDLSSSLNFKAISYINENNYERAIETLNLSINTVSIYSYLEEESYNEYIIDWMSESHYECRIDSQTSIIRELNDATKEGYSIFICDGCNEVILEFGDDAPPDYYTGVQTIYWEQDFSMCLIDICYHLLESTVFSEEECYDWCENSVVRYEWGDNLGGINKNILNSVILCDCKD